MHRAREIKSSDRPWTGSAFDVVVVGASLGGRAVLEQMLAALPLVFPAPILVVQHVRAHAVSYLPELLAVRTKLAVRHAVGGESLRASRVYIAPPNHDLVIGADRCCVLTTGLQKRLSRPAVDPLFHSAADVFGARTLGVVLTGRLDDGAAGAAAIRHRGGVVLAQELATCVAPSMPRAAIDRGAVQIALPPEALGPALVALVTVPGARAIFGLGERLAA